MVPWTHPPQGLKCDNLRRELVACLTMHLIHFVFGATVLIGMSSISTAFAGSDRWDLSDWAVEKCQIRFPDKIKQECKSHSGERKFADLSCPNFCTNSELVSKKNKEHELAYQLFTDLKKFEVDGRNVNCIEADKEARELPLKISKFERQIGAQKKRIETINFLQAGNERRNQNIRAFLNRVQGGEKYIPVESPAGNQLIDIIKDMNRDVDRVNSGASDSSEPMFPKISFMDSIDRQEILNRINAYARLLAQKKADSRKSLSALSKRLDGITVKLSNAERDREKCNPKMVEKYCHTLLRDTYKGQLKYRNEHKGDSSQINYLGGPACSNKILDQEVQETGPTEPAGGGAKSASD